MIDGCGVGAGVGLGAGGGGHVPTGASPSAGTSPSPAAKDLLRSTMAPARDSGRLTPKPRCRLRRMRSRPTSLSPRPSPWCSTSPLSGPRCRQPSLRPVATSSPPVRVSLNTVVQNKLLTGIDSNGSAADGSIEVNFRNPWAYGDSVSSSQYDFKSTMMHEMLHAYGFLAYVDEAGWNTGTNWTKFDSFIVTNVGTKVINRAHIGSTPPTTPTSPVGPVDCSSAARMPLRHMEVGAALHAASVGAGQFGFASG